MPYATVADVEARLGRQLTAEEEIQATALLEDAEALLVLRIPDLHSRVTDETLPERVVVMVEVNMVLRVLRNPDAFISETDGNYSYQRSSSGASGYLEVLPREWDWLLGGNTMYQIVPVLDQTSPAEGFSRQPNAHYWVDGMSPYWSWYAQ